MRPLRLLTVVALFAGGLACDPVAPTTPDWLKDDPDGNPSDSDEQPADDETGADDDPQPGDPRNNPPRANAGPDLRDIVPNTLVNLEGGGSTDVDADPLTYTWTALSKPPGSASTISNSTFASAQIYVDKAGEYNISLEVSDGRLTATDSMKITVLIDNTPPRANAGIDQTVNVGTNVQLVGSGSTDADGDSLEYYWTLSTPPGSGTTLSGALIASAAVNPSFVADAAGIFTAALEVYDGEARSAPDLVVITSRDTSSSGGGSSGSSSGSSDCLDCAAHVDDVALTAWSAGDLASGFGLLVLPVFVSLWQRRREED